MAKVSFKEIHTNLSTYMEARKEYPVVTFEDNETVLRQLRGKSFMFAAMKGEDKHKKPQLGIMVVEKTPVGGNPVCALTAADKAKDRRFKVQFQGKLLLLDEEVNVLLQQLGNRMKAAALTSNLAQGASDGSQTTQ
jgi:hypothetical protein